MSAWQAALPMYNVGDEVTALYRHWLVRLLQRLAERGFREPVTLAEPDAALLDWWQRDDLLLSQTCGYPLMTRLRERVVPLATPAYRFAGCQGGFYRSALLVPADSAIQQLADACGRRVVANQPDSHSGMNALRAAVAPLAGHGHFFGSVTWSGSHAASIEALLAGSADLPRSMRSPTPICSGSAPT
jgi:ABC-type phosphate/phosphonate transport system substrate-binding protein